MSYTIDNVPTPALVIDVPTAFANIERMAAYCREHGLNLRPHTKTHKLVLMGRKQIEAGAIGLTVAKVGEAEALAEAADDFLIAYPTLDPARTGRVAELAKRKTIRVAVDSTYAAERIAEAAAAAGSTVGVIVDRDTGFGRTGVQSADEVLAIAKVIDGAKGVRFDGLFTFPGHLSRGETRDAGLAKVDQILTESIDALKAEGLSCEIVSGGSTPTAFHSHQVSSYTEIRPGTYIYNDRDCVGMNWCEPDDAAAKLICTVVSTAVPDKCILDGGSKTFTSDMYFGQVEMGYGDVEGFDGARLLKLTEEHGEVDLRNCTNGRPKLGQRVNVVMNHVCPTVNLQTQVWLDHGDGKLEAMTVDARGKLS